MSIKRAWDSDTSLLESGFHETTDEPVAEPLVCPSCEVTLKGEKDIKVQGDSWLCAHCGAPLTDAPAEVAEDTAEVEDEEEEDLEDYYLEGVDDGSHDYEDGD